MIYTLTLNPAIDYVMRPLTLDMGFTNRSSSEEFRCGGNGINIACVLNELGVSNCAMGILGGFTGAYILDTLQEIGVTCNFVQLERGNTRVNVKLDGIAMTMVNGIGPKVPQSKLDELFERMDRIDEGDTLVLTGSIPSTLPDTIYQSIMTRLSGRGIRFVVDAPGQELVKALPAKPFLIKPNNHELGRLFDVRPETPEECLPYAHLLHERGAANVIVSCGGHGSALIDADGKDHIADVPPSRLVNATGAGDSMVAGFLAKIDETGDYDQALRFASCCGSATAASRGLAKKATVEKYFVQLNELMDKKAAGEPTESRPKTKAKSSASGKASTSKKATTPKKTAKSTGKATPEK